MGERPAILLAFGLLVEVRKLHDLKMLSTIVLLILVQNDSSAGRAGLQDRSGAVRALMVNAQTPVFSPEKAQTGGILKVWDNSELFVLDLEISLYRAIDAEAIFDALVDTIRWDSSTALFIGGDNAELELLEVLVST